MATLTLEIDTGYKGIGPTDFFQRTTLLPRIRSYASIDFIDNLLLATVTVIHHDTIVSYKVYNGKIKKFQHVHRLRT